MEEMPGDVLHDRRVAREDGLCVQDLPFFWTAPDVPQADGLRGRGGGVWGSFMSKQT